MLRRVRQRAWKLLRDGARRADYRTHVRSLFEGFVLGIQVLRRGLAQADVRRMHLRTWAVRSALLLVAVGLFAACERRDRADAAAEVEDGPPPRVRAITPGWHIGPPEPPRRAAGTSEAPTRIDRVHVGPLDLTIVKDDADETDVPAKPKRGKPKKQRSRDLWARLSSIYGFAVLFEWALVALSRKYDEQVARRLALASGIVPEDPEEAPRIRLDPRWAYRKVRQRIRGFVVFGAGFPAYLFTLVTPLSFFDAAPAHAGFDVIVVGWAIYWSGVFAASKSAHAWHDEATAPPPAFLRTFAGAFGAAPLLRYWARAWSWATRGLFAPAATFERHPFGFWGFALFRIVSHVPFVYTFVRPAVPVVSAALIARHDARARLPVPDASATTRVQSAPEALPSPHALGA
jgi:hypothetical protein